MRKEGKAFLTGAQSGGAAGTVIGLCCWALWALWAHYRYGLHGEIHLMMFAGIFLGFALGVQFSMWRARVSHRALMDESRLAWKGSGDDA